jgi:1,4-alpha-glucan branching enzyme
VAEASNSLELTYTFTATRAGNFKLTAKATKGSTTDSQTIDIVVFAPSEVAALPSGAKLGINYLSNTEVILALQAPGKSIAHVMGDFNDWKVLPEYQLKKTADGKIFWIKLSGLVPQKEYIFQYLALDHA